MRPLLLAVLLALPWGSGCFTAGGDAAGSEVRSPEEEWFLGAAAHYVSTNSNVLEDYLDALGNMSRERYSQAARQFSSADVEAAAGVKILDRFGEPPSEWALEGHRLMRTALGDASYAADRGSSCAIERDVGHAGGSCSEWSAAGDEWETSRDAAAAWIQAGIKRYPAA